MSSGKNYFAHESACIDKPCEIGENTAIWHFCHIMKHSRIGARCVLGQNVFVAGDVIVGNGVRIQNNVSLYAGTIVEDDVFIGPSAVLTNVKNPRAEISRREQFETTLLRRGATIGANATIVCGITIGRYAFVGAGAVVTRDVPDYALVTGVAARRTGWVSRHGRRLPQPDKRGLMVCPESGYQYVLQGGVVTCVDLPESEPLPQGRSRG